MIKEVEDFFSKYDKSIQDAGKMAAITRDKQMQIDAASQLELLLQEASTLKNNMISNKNEDEANLLLGIECSMSSLVNLLNMWISLKDDDPDKAWDFLVDAESLAIDATRAHSKFGHLSDHYIKLLLAIERLIFPPQIFFSNVTLDYKETCSVCGNEYEDCDHLVGKAYMGQFCVIIVDDFKLIRLGDIVKNPSNKHCRVKYFDDGSGNRNHMTLRIEKKVEGEQEDK